MARKCASISNELRDCLASVHSCRWPNETPAIVFYPEAASDVVSVGSIRSPEVFPASTLRVHATARRVRRDGLVVFRLVPTTTASFIDLVHSTQLIDAVIRIENCAGAASTAALYNVKVTQATDSHGCIDIVVPIDAETVVGSQVVLRSVSIAGCDVALSDAPLRVIVGFENDPAPAGRAYAAVEACSFTALMQALNDGCSMQECNVVSVEYVSLPGIFLESACPSRCIYAVPVSSPCSPHPAPTPV
jgi:hypothetical protein